MIQIKLPKPDLPIESQDLDVLFAMQIFGESRLDDRDEDHWEEFEMKAGVGHVAYNRSKHPGWWGKDLRQVLLKFSQFSCFNVNDPNRVKLLDPLAYEPSFVWDACYIVAAGILDGIIPDPTLRSDSYFDDSLVKTNKMPRWAEEKNFVKQIGKFLFYRIYLPKPTLKERRFNLIYQE